jgi:tetratricopeptide (TPR) repeat protein
MKLHRNLCLLLTLAFLAAPAAAADLLVYADKDGTIHRVQVYSVSKDDGKNFHARILVGGRKRKLSIPARLVVSFRRGDPDAKNQWAKQIARGLRLQSSGQLATEGTVPGAEETFAKVAYTTEKGIPGEEEAYAALPWHNMYALYYLIETRYTMGTQGEGNEAKLQTVLGNVEQFKLRSTKKRHISWQVPGAKGTTRKQEVYCWGPSRLEPEVLLYEAKILAALKQKDKALNAFDAVIDRAKKEDLSPDLLTRAIIGKAELEAAGEPSDKQESIFRSAGTTMAGMVRSQPDAYGRTVLSRASNRALLRGADLLLASAEEGKVGWDMPLNRYRALKAGEGKRDPALSMGAQAGIGVCLAEMGKGEEAYRSLLEVAVKGHEYPEQMAQALYYLGRACKLYADEVDSGGGSGDFLREESSRWWADLQQRYPRSRWAEKVTQK